MSGKGCYGGNKEVIREKLLKEDQQEQMATSDARELTRSLLVKKGYSPEEIREDATISLQSPEGDKVEVGVDFLVSIDGNPHMAVKCSMALESRERHVLAIARAAFDNPVPLCAITDGIHIRVFLTSSGTMLSDLPDEFPGRAEILDITGPDTGQDEKLSPRRREMESMILLAFEVTDCPRVES